MSEARRRQDLLYYMVTFLGTWYRYGGNYRESGIDCSGLVNAGLRRFELVPDRDHTAHWLYLYFAGKRTKYYRATGHDPGPLTNRLTQAIESGNILFFGRRKGTGFRMTHVAVAIDACRMIEARGGTSRVNSLAAAIDNEARVAITQISRRAVVGIADPF